jgi:protein-tyrosine-phosphatase
MRKQKSPIEQSFEKEKQKPRNILFVCGGNKNRSIEGERVFRSMLTERGYRVFDSYSKKAQKDYEVIVSSAGIYVNKMRNSEDGKEIIGDTRKQLNGDEADKADIIFALDEEVKYMLVKRYIQPREKIISLDIEDIFDIDNDEHKLIKLLREKLSIYIPLP